MASHKTTHGKRSYCVCVDQLFTMATPQLRKAGVLKANETLYDFVTNGCYTTSVTASKNTHSRGGVIDLPYRFSTPEVQRIFDQHGGVAFRRESWEFTSTKTPSHTHMAVRGCPDIAASAQDQLDRAALGYAGMAVKTRRFIGVKPTGPTIQKAWQNWTNKAAPAAPAPAPKPTPNSGPKRISFSYLMKSMPPTAGKNSNCALVQDWLRAEGLYAFKSDGIWGPKSISAYAAWQRKLGYSGKAADGIPGLASLRKLATKHGYVVVD